MAEEQGQKKKSGLMGLLILVMAMVVVSVGAALAVYVFVLSPMFAEEQEKPEDEGIETAPVDPTYPATVVLLDFDKLRAAALVDDPGASAPLLQYAVSLVCANAPTAALIESKRQLFQAKIVELHSNRTKKELNDPLARSSILKQVQQEINALLQRLQEEPDPEIRVLEALYTEFTVLDL